MIYSALEERKRRAYEASEESKDIDLGGLITMNDDKIPPPPVPTNTQHSDVQAQPAGQAGQVPPPSGCHASHLAPAKPTIPAHAGSLDNAPTTPRSAQVSSSILDFDWMSPSVRGDAQEWPDARRPQQEESPGELAWRFRSADEYASEDLEKELGRIDAADKEIVTGDVDGNAAPKTHTTESPAVPPETPKGPSQTSTVAPAGGRKQGERLPPRSLSARLATSANAAPATTTTNKAPSGRPKPRQINTRRPAQQEEQAVAAIDSNGLLQRLESFLKHGPSGKEIRVWGEEWDQCVLSFVAHHREAGIQVSSIRTEEC